MQNKQSSQKKILVIDDDQDILNFLDDLLQMEGYQVAVSPKVDFLENPYNEDWPDLILLDVFLSGKDGRDLVKQLKKQRETRQIPIIMFSAHPIAEETARAAGADDFLAKPFDLDDLLAKVQVYLF